MKIKRNVVVDLKRAFPSLGSDISENGLVLIHEGRFANAAVLRYRDRNLDLTIKDFSGSPLLIKAVFGILSTRTEYRAKKALAEALGENGNLCLLSPWSLAFDYVCGETLNKVPKNVPSDYFIKDGANCPQVACMRFRSLGFAQFGEYDSGKGRATLYH